MKTAVSIPDDVFAEAERLVQRLKISRSELYAAALREYLARRDQDAITAALDRVYADVDDQPDSAVVEAGIRTLQRAEW
jgi:metal-responsive CopG/Arc/MetJ family transcriptional regulator